MQTCDFSIIASWLLLDLHVDVGAFLRVCCVLLERSAYFPFGCFWVTASVKLLYIFIVSFACTTLTLFMCFTE